MPVACLTNLFEGLWRRITTACQEILDQSRDDRQDQILWQLVESHQESGIPSVRHRPECQTRQDTNNPIIPKASVSVITGQETVSVSLPDGSVSQGHVLTVPMP